MKLFYKVIGLASLLLTSFNLKEENKPYLEKTIDLDNNLEQKVQEIPKSNPNIIFNGRLGDVKIRYSEDLPIENRMEINYDSNGPRKMILVDNKGASSILKNPLNIYDQIELIIIQDLESGVSRTNKPFFSPNPIDGMYNHQRKKILAELNFFNNL